MNDFNIFDLEDEFSNENSTMQFIPVPWEASTSYRCGTIEGPSAIFESSAQIDLFDLDVVDPYKCGMFMDEEELTIRQLSSTARRTKLDKHFKKMHDYVQKLTNEKLEKDQIPVIVGGDHSVPFGAWTAIDDQFGILQIDAHMDLRNGYQGFTYSHASIMHNALTKIPNISNLTQIGIRDFCKEEHEFAKEHEVQTCFDSEIQEAKINGGNLNNIFRQATRHLPDKVWISFDIDGLDPSLCPNTGTPVPGGLGLNEALYIIKKIALSRKIIGFDLVEVAPDPENKSIDANVAMRLLYKISAYVLASQGLAKWRE